MMEQLTLVGNALVAVAYVVSVALVVRTRQVRTDRVAAAAALFFAAGGAWYGVQVLLSWQAAVGAVSTIGLPAASPLWKGSLAVWDVFTAGVGVWYWTVRDRYPVFGLGARAQVVVGQPEAVAEHDTSTATLRHAEQARDEAMQSAVRARREALAQSQVNEQLMATMGYEIRTPMSGVIGLATLLLTTELDPVQRRYAAGLHTAGNDLLGVLNAILDPSVEADPAAAVDATLLAATALPAPAGADPASATRSPSPSPKRVLVVEDNEINQMVAVGMLTGLGYQPDVANDGIEAVDMAAAHEYDAVLMDCRMPRMDGFDATVELRRHEGTGRHTPIIALTANALVGDRARCLDAGMDDCLAKPVNSADLDATLARWIEDAALNEVHARRSS
ncbi:MAG: hypothetical protein V7603_5788 [Micromonosporaceae bacterium]